ncbi:MAG: T9SS type A sorting domain-containing protein [Chitinophagales bacterium]
MKSAILIKFICSSILVAITYTNINAQGIITTWLGNGTAGYSGDNGPANLAQINHPYGIAFDGAGNFYIADQGNFAIRKINSATGVITTIAGNGSQGFSGDEGLAVNATLGSLYGICVDASNNIYLTDWDKSVVREINASTGIITTIAGNGTSGYSGDNGPAVNAQLNQPEGLCIFSGNLYITDKIENCIRKVNLSTGIITTIAGNGSIGYTGDGGPASSSTLYAPSAICADVYGNLYIADEQNLVIRKITAATGIISTIVGTGAYGFTGNGGPATSANIGFIQGICVDSHGDIYINDASCSCRKITASTGIINIVAGSDSVDGYSGDGGYATSGLLNNPTGLCVDPITGTITIADYENYRIRRATQPGFTTKTNYIVAEAKPSVYPNPSAGNFFIQIPDDQKNSVAEIFSISGEKVFNALLKENVTNINVSWLPDGNYIVNLRSCTGNDFMQKITVSK